MAEVFFAPLVRFAPAGMYHPSIYYRAMPYRINPYRISIPYHTLRHVGCFALQYFLVKTPQKLWDREKHRNSCFACKLRVIFARYTEVFIAAFVGFSYI